MTSHRLLRCHPARVLASAADRNRALTADEFPDDVGWRHPRPQPHRTVRWCSQLPDGSVVGWCLEVEPGANGTLTHLTAVPVAGPVARLPRTLRRLALLAWTEQQLGRLARAVEQDHPRRHRGRSPAATGLRPRR